MVEVTTL
jgi:hypothetical protein